MDKYCAINVQSSIRRTVFSVELLNNISKEMILFQHSNKVVEHLSGVFDTISEAGDEPGSFLVIRHAPSGEHPAV